MTATLDRDADRGDLKTLDDGWEIRFERRLRHSPERVWNALTTPAGLACWLADAKIDPTPGGEMILRFTQPDHPASPDTDENRTQTNEVLVFQPFTRFEHTFGSAEDSIVSWRLTPDGDGTHLVLVHRIPDRWKGARANVMSGWQTHLEGFEDAIHGVPHAWSWDRWIALRDAWAAGSEKAAPMIVSAAPFLMFQGRCEEALTFYAATLPGARILSLDRQADGKVAMARLFVGGLEIMANDSPPVHDFDFTPSTSTFLIVETVEEVDALIAALGEGGRLMMPPGNYGFSQRFGWAQDRFGVSWQVNRP